MASIGLTPAAILQRDREAAQRLVMDAGQKKTQAILRRAQNQLQLRLKTAQGLSGPGKDSFTVAQLRATLAQVKAVTAHLQVGMQGVVLEQGQKAAEQAAALAVKYLHAAETHFKGSTDRLNLDGARMADRAVAGTQSSLLSRLLHGDDPKKRSGILQRYGANVVGHFEDHLQAAMVAKTPWHEVRQQLTDSSPFLQGAPAHWAERIVRTETMFAQNRAGQQAISDANDQLGDMCKIISSTFDSRTGCLLAGARVSSGVVRAVFRRPYEGPMLHIVTEAGRQLAATPNHPMLSRSGWVSADALRCGDYLVCDGREQDSSSAGEQDRANHPPTIGEVFDSLQTSGVGERRCGRQQDFHGDGSDREVDVFSPLDQLRLHCFTALDQPVAHGVFAPSHDVEFCPQCGGLLSADAGVEARRLRPASQGNPEHGQPQGHGRLSGSEHLGDAFERSSRLVEPCEFGVRELLEAGVPVPRELLFGVAMDPTDSSVLDCSVDPSAVSFHRCRDFVPGESRHVQVDRVVSIEVRTFQGHVFNLSTEDGYFAANGLYTGNSDSFAVHGEIRRPDESFQSWFGSYMHPPDRPNDRSVVVPHRISWEIPGELKPKGYGAVAARWSAEGRKGSPPPSPLMTTIPLEQFGKPAGPAPSQDADSDAQAPAEQALARPVDRRVAPQDQGSLRARWPEEPPELARPVSGFESAGQSAAGLRSRWPEESPELFAPPPVPFSPIAQQVSPQAGSNPGGVFEGTDGVQRYVKFYQDPAQAVGEHLANSLYGDLGIQPKLNSLTFEHEGKLAYASEILPNTTELGKKLATLKPAAQAKLAKKALDGFAADVLTANWDVAGLSLDNMLVGADGSITRIDNGASFLTRAKGARKPTHQLNDPTEWSSFFDPNKNPAYAKLAKLAGVSGPADLAASIQKGVKSIVNVRNNSGGWAAYVEKRAAGLAVADKQKIVGMLESRTNFLEQASKNLSAAAKVAKKTAAAKAKLPPGSAVPIDKDAVAAGKRSYSAKLPAATHFLSAHQHLPSLQEYTGSAYRRINGALAGVSKESAHEIGQHLQTAQRINSVLAAAKDAGHALDGVVLRGFKGSEATVKAFTETDVHTLAGFTSTTTDENIARNFASSSHPVFLRIRTRSAVPIDSVSRCKGEMEALLPSGTKIRIISRSTEVRGGTTWLNVDAEEL